jgi:hypothetical protein
MCVCVYAVSGLSGYIYRKVAVEASSLETEVYDDGGSKDLSYMY